uniref:Efflux RND transporter periplasmic adaptor subunit n=1 Tax=Desulfobacca acetoxidans TaxID=60893 RepID=A0A7V6A2M0_9BACT
MTPDSRSSLWRGLVLGIILVIAALAALYGAGFRLVGPGTSPQATAETKPLCYVSPTDKSYIRFSPGKDKEGQELQPVYPTQPGAMVSGQTIELWMSPTDPQYVRTEPGVDPGGQKLVQFTGVIGAPLAASGAPAAAAGKKERKIKYWVSPMDPGYIRDKPGKAPCGMDLVPVYETAEEEAPGTIKVSPAAIQSMGVTTTKVQVRPLSRVTLTVGSVTFDERSLNVITTKMDGWVERLYVRATGDPIRRGQPLLSLYSPELVTTQQEYLLALRNSRTMQKSKIPEYQQGGQQLLEAARERLKLWDIPDSEIARLEQTGEVRKTLTLNSPVSGFVTKRLVTQGMYVKAGMPALEVADLSTIWVDADIYQYELPWIKVGQPVTMTLDYLPGESFPGRIDYIYPYLKEATRTATVRLRFPNPGLRLKPAMFSQVKIESPVTLSTVVVPSNAVINTGLKQYVFLALGEGRFVPREVQLGVLGNDGMHQVLSGLQGGEEVVTSAQFMLDSESRFREAVQMMMPNMEMGAEKEKKPMAMPGMKMEEKSPPPMPAMPGGHTH